MMVLTKIEDIKRKPRRWEDMKFNLSEVRKYKITDSIEIIYDDSVLFETWLQLCPIFYQTCFSLSCIYCKFSCYITGIGTWIFIVMIINC